MVGAISARTVFFLDHEGWSAFDQLACAFRREGISAIKVCANERKRSPFRDPHLRWWADHLFYNETLAIDRPRDVERMENLMTTGRVADVIVAEPTLMAVGFESELGSRLTAHSLAFQTTPPAILLDKFEVNRRLCGIGLDVPRQIRVTEVTPEDVIAEFGFPIVLKACTGAAGASVRIANSLAEVEEAIAVLGFSEKLFYQEYVAGARVSYNAVVGPRGPVLEHGFVSCKAQYPMGPSASVKIFDDPALLDAGRAAAKLFGCQGFVSFGFIQNSDGRVFHLDPNIRPWGSLLAPVVEGIDYPSAYVALLYDRPGKPHPTSSLSSTELITLPGSLVYAKSVSSFLRALVTLCRVSAVCLTHRYTIVIFVRAILVGMTRVADRVGRKGTVH